MIYVVYVGSSQPVSTVIKFKPFFIRAECKLKISNRLAGAAMFSTRDDLTLEL